MLKRSKKQFLFAEMGDLYACGLVVDRGQAPCRVEKAFAFFGEELEDCAGKIGTIASMDRKSNLTQGSVAVYPGNRFLFRHVTENSTKTKGADYGAKTLRDELNRKAEDYRFVCLHPRTGLPHDALNAPSREVLLAGAPLAELRACQTKLLSCGVYPRHLELGSLGIFAGVRHMLEQEPPGRSVLTIELGRQDLHAYVVDRDGLLLTESLGLGLDSITSALQTELSQRDTASAQRMLLSRTFDFADIGPVILAEIVHRLRNSTNAFESRTGKSISHLYLPLSEHGFHWVREALCQQLGLEPWDPDLQSLTGEQQIDFSPVAAEAENLLRWFPVICLLSSFSRESLQTP